MKRILILIPLLTGLPSCHVSWYGQAVRGQLEVLSKTRPTDVVLANPETTPELRKRLQLVQQLLEFAENELELPHDGNYSGYADLERDAVMWAVYAAPEFDVEPIEWKAPVVGSISYRGYFDKKAAEAFAKRMREQRGLDTAIVPVPAYSTLGWFRDPILNTFIDYDEANLAGLIFHELTHKKLYRPNETDFNEALAVAVEQEGVRRWLTKKGDSAALARYQRQQAALRRFVSKILDLREELRALYASDILEIEKRSRKKKLLDDLQNYINKKLREAGKDNSESFWLREDLTNAHLNLAAVYFLRVPEFEVKLKAADGDFSKFFRNLGAQ